MPTAASGTLATESRTSRRKLDAGVRDQPDLVVLADLRTGEILDANHHGAAVLGWTIDELTGMNVTELGTKDEPLQAALFEDLAEGKTVYFDAALLAADGSRRPYNIAARCVVDRPNDVLLVARELGAIAHSRSELAKLMMLADLTDDVFLVCDREGYITYANAACRSVHQAEVPVGRHMTEFLAADDEGYRQLLEAYRRDDGRAEARVSCVAADGSHFVLGVRTIYDRESELWYTVERDITTELTTERELRRLADDMRHQATTDALTGVANRYALNACLREAIEQQRPFALLLLDMDDFKSVNDTLGHAAGDEFLRGVASRMQQSVRLVDMVARLGGDEFVTFLPDVDREVASDIAQRMIEAVGEQFTVAGKALTRSCSVGVAVWEAGEDVNAVLRKADRCAYRAKHEGRSRFVVN